MKFSIILISLLFFGYSMKKEKDPCAKSFVKESKSKKGSSFGEVNTFQTKYALLDNSHARKLSMAFRFDDNKSFLQIQVYYNSQAISFKREFNFSSLTKVALTFSDSSTTIVDFVDIQNTRKNSELYIIGYSNILVNDTIISEISDKLLTKIELLNPFSERTIKADKVYIKDVQKQYGEKLSKFAGCYLDRKKNQPNN